MAGQDPARRSRRRGPIGFLLVVLLGLLAITRLTGGGRFFHDSDESGLLEAHSVTDIGITPSIDVGEAVTVGRLVVSHTGRKPLVLESLRLLPLFPEGLELVGVLTTEDPDREPVSFAGSGFPPEEALVGGTRPLKGASIAPATEVAAPGRGTAILVGLRLTKPGVYRFESVARRPGTPTSARSADG
jgi:hypothetical protein